MKLVNLKDAYNNITCSYDKDITVNTDNIEMIEPCEDPNFTILYLTSGQRIPFHVTSKQLITEIIVGNSSLYKALNKDVE